MRTLYRACPFNSSNRPPIFEEDKIKLLEMCLESFIKAKPKEITFLLDRMPEEQWKMFSKYGEIVDCSGLGNVGTFHKQIEMGRMYGKVFFCEDDYYWRPDTFPLLEKAVDTFDFVSPYDHPSHYVDDPRFERKYEVQLIDNIAYRDSPSNTLTFATTDSVLQDNWTKMMTFGIADHPMFEALRQDGYRIWCPTYSFATHMVNGLLAPNVPWHFI